MEVMKILVGSSEGKRPLGGRYRMKLRKIERASFDLLYLDLGSDWWRALVGKVMKLRVAYNTANSFSRLATEYFFKKKFASWRYLLKNSITFYKLFRFLLSFQIYFL
jgi:hypothetical protein